MGDDALKVGSKLSIQPIHEEAQEHQEAQCLLHTGPRPSSKSLIPERSLEKRPSTHKLPHMKVDI